MRKICVITATRAEYGVFRKTLEKIERSEKLELFLVVTGTHFSEKYGRTLEEIGENCYTNVVKLPLKEYSDSEMRTSLEMSELMARLAEVFQKIRPDIILIMGDRYELLAVASTAVAMHIPIAHLSGGESSEGAMDEQIRHAITKMAHIHFPGAKEYAERIRRMGEEAWRVKEVGDPAMENIKNMRFIAREELERQLGVAINRQTLLITYHPVTLEKDSLEQQMDNLLAALAEYEGSQIITFPNADDGSDYIIGRITEYGETRDHVCVIESLGIERYLSVMHYCGAVVGNSSSAIIEAPYMHTPAVNIGNRQKGRLMAESIICCSNAKEDIGSAIRKALSPAFREIAERCSGLYGEGNTSDEIVAVLESIPIDEKLMMKKLEW